MKGILQHQIGVNGRSDAADTRNTRSQYQRQQKAEHKPSRQERQAFERKALELVKELGDDKGDHKRHGLLLESDLNAKVLDQRKHIFLPVLELHEETA